MTFSVEILGCPYRIVAETEQVGRPLQDLTSGFTSPPESRGKVIKISSAFSVSGFGAESKCYDSVTDTLVGVEHDLYRDALDRCGDIALHAAVVQKSGRTTLLAGGSGSGKTTLTLGLLGKGWTLLSDEVAPLAPDTGTVRPFPRCPGASAATLKLLTWPTERSKHVYLRNTFCLLPETLKVAAAARYPVDRVIFIKRAAKASLVPMDSASGMARLIQLISGQTNRKQVFDTAGRVAESASFCALGNGELPETINYLESLA